MPEHDQPIPDNLPESSNSSDSSDSADWQASRDDIVNAALAWHQFRNGISERALTVAIERFLQRAPRPGASGKSAAVQVTRPKEASAVAGAGAQSAALVRPSVVGDYEIYSDGSALNNPGPAGCGWVVLGGGKVIYEGFESIGFGTNQVAEIRAAAHGLNDLPAGSSADVHTDSLYVVQTMKGAFKKKANLEHWAFLEEAVRRHRVVRFHHVKGHNGHDMNERADRLANRGALLSKNRLA